MKTRKSTRAEPWEAKAFAGDHAGAILSYVAAHDHVTFAELVGALDGPMPARGECELSLDTAEHGRLVLWAGVSEPFGAAVEELRWSGELLAVPTSAMTYMMEGATLDLPVARVPPRGGYREPHWVPVVLRTREQEEATGWT